MKILVTGSEGYIGNSVTSALKKAGHDVVGLDTGFYRSGLLFYAGQDLPAVITKDIRDITTEDLVGFDAVVHMAELSNDPLGQTNEQLTYEINHEATMRFARLCKEVEIGRFIYFSSCSVYGASENVSDEQSETHPLTAYAKSKVMNERGLAELADDTFSPVFFRNATAFGASPRLRFDLVVNNLAGCAWTTKKIRLESDGQAWRPFVHVKDIATAAVCALQAEKSVVHNEIFNVGDTNGNYRIIDIAELVKKVFPECEIEFGSHGHDDRNYRVSFEKINTKLTGFSCAYSVEDGLRQLRRVFEVVHLTHDMFVSRDYTRLKQIQYLLATKQINEQLFWNTIL